MMLPWRKVNLIALHLVGVMRELWPLRHHLRVHWVEVVVWWLFGCALGLRLLPIVQLVSWGEKNINVGHR